MPTQTKTIETKVKRNANVTYFIFLHCAFTASRCASAQNHKFTISIIVIKLSQNFCHCPIMCQLRPRAGALVRCYFEPFVDIVKFWDGAGVPCSLATLVPDCLCHVSFRRYWPLKLPLGCEVVEKRRKRWLLAPNFKGRG